MIVSEIYVEDIDYYDSMTSNAKASHYTPTISGAVANINEYSEQGWKYGYASQFHTLNCDYIPNIPFEMSFEVTDKNNGYSNAVYFTHTTFINFMSNNNSIQMRTGSSYTTYNVSVIGKWTIKAYNNKYEVYHDDIFIGERSIGGNPSIRFEVGHQSTRWIQLRNLKIKRL